MKKRQNNSARASALQITLSIALLSVSAILFASSFKAAPGRTEPIVLAQAGFYPSLPLPADPDGQTLTVSLPIATMDTSVPIATVIPKPVNCTPVVAGQRLIGFQGDFLFDSAIFNFDTVAG